MSTSKNINKQREYGAYYTPISVSKMLSDWAIQLPTDHILEPGFGGCGFLEASKECLIKLGVSSINANKQIFGCDVDKRAFNHLYEKIGPVDLSQRFLKGDFLALTPSSFSIHQFDAVIGNPPYVSLHNMPDTQRKQALSSIKNTRYKIGKRASLWGYFILHALHFLKSGGRCAWVLPSSFLNANYSSSIREILESKFSGMLIIPLSQRLFMSEGAEESSIILLADGWNLGPAKKGAEVAYATVSSDIPLIISNWKHKKKPYPKLPSYEKGTFSYLDINSQYSYRALQKAHEVTTLGSVVNVRIGIVTGANDFFIINNETVNKEGISLSALHPILAKFAQSKGLELTDNDLKENAKNNIRCLLLNTKGRKQKLKGVQSYLDSFPQDKIPTNATFSKRLTWHLPDDYNNPDAFLSYMCDHGPRLVLNKANTTCTNSVHRIFFKENVDQSIKMLLAISLQTSLTQLSAELVGRNYGSGVLKLEPSEASRLSIALPQFYSKQEIKNAFEKININLRNNNIERARKYANRFILKPFLSDKYDSTIVVLNESIRSLRELRRNFKNIK